MKRFSVFVFFVFVIQLIHAQESESNKIAYNNIDSLILYSRTPDFSSTKQLADFVNNTFHNEADKLRAIFCWIANNIEYDYNADANPEVVFKTKKGVCQGYAELMKHLCDLTGINCTVIEGIAKNGVEYIIDPVDTSNHSWNLVILNNKKYLLDVTWSAGYSSDGENFIKAYRDDYYLTNPEVFVLTHLPVNPDFQLLPHKISKDTFCKSPAFSYGAIKCKMTSFYPISAILNADAISKLNFSFNLNTQIYDLDYAICDDPTQEVEIEDPIEFLQSGNKLTFNLKMKKAGVFFLVFYIDKNEAFSYKVIVN